MAKSTIKPLADYFMPLHINGLSGHVLLAPASTNKSREILVVYDQHSSLERWESLSDELRRYGRVSMPDLPGFGGMRSFYRIDQQASIDNLAGYLAAFIKLRYKRKSLTIIGLGFGFVVVTRMLQSYPDLAKKVNLLVAIDSFSHHDDMQISPLRRRLSMLTKRFFRLKLPAMFYRNVVLYPLRLRLSSRTQLRIGKQKYGIAELDNDDRKNAVNSNIKLWRNNDTRTYMQSTLELLGLDNCRKTVDLPLYHVVSKDSEAFDPFQTEQHLGVVFRKVVTIQSALPDYGTIGIVPVQNTSQILPRKLRGLLLKN